MGGKGERISSFASQQCVLGDRQSQVLLSPLMGKLKSFPIFFFSDFSETGGSGRAQRWPDWAQI